MSAVLLPVDSSRALNIPNTFQPVRNVDNRNSFISTIFDRTVKNPVFWALALSGLSVAAITFVAIAFPPITAGIIAVSLVAALAIGAYCNKDELKRRAICELGLIGNTLKTSFPILNFPSGWYTQITPDITLGGNPLKTHGHFEAISGSHGAVLSMVEPHETLPYMTGVPTTPADWREREHITFLNLANPDMTPVRDLDVDRGVEFLHSQISGGKRVYVHCNGGIGRSATIVICYLIKYWLMSAKEAAKLVNDRRSIVVDENSDSIRSFVQRHGFPRT